MDQGVRNLAQKVGLPLADAPAYGDPEPGGRVGTEDLGRVAIGAKADFVLFWMTGSSLRHLCSGQTGVQRSLSRTTQKRNKYEE